MSVSRRSFLGTSTTFASGFTLPWRSIGKSIHKPFNENPELLTETVVFSMVTKALDAAKAAGASYAEVSLDRRLGQTIGQSRDSTTGIGLSDSTRLSVGVRVLVNGRWGHASSNQLEDAELVRIANAAVRQGKANSNRRPRDMNWEQGGGTVGRYITEGIDPFSVPLEEKVDFLNSWRTTVSDFRDPIIAAAFEDCSFSYQRTERGYVNSNGCKQYSIVYGCDGTLPITGSYKDRRPISSLPPKLCEGLYLQQGGWDIVRDARPHDQIPTIAEQSAQATMIGISPVDVGRYDIVCDATTVANIIGHTVGRASELDRAIGYEANAGGTSYLGPNPYDHLGTSIASPSITVSANRGLPKGLATIPWDAEGSPVKTFNIVQDGVLVDYVTNRELAPLLNKWYAEKYKTVGSNSCAVQDNSTSFPLPALPNIRVHPGPDGASEQAQIAAVKRGYYIPDVKRVSVSFQCQDGFFPALAREIINGKLGNYVQLGIMFNATELLKSAVAIGDASTTRNTPFYWSKGEPNQGGVSTIEGVPMTFSNVPVIDPTRKA